MLGGVIVAFLVLAVIILYVVPSRTEDLWAWTIDPELSSMTLACAYISGAYFFSRVAAGGSWTRVGAGFLPVFVFVCFMAGATALHLDRFNTDHVSFFAWALLYALTPFVVPLVWLRNERAAGRPDAGGTALPGWLRAVLGSVGALVVAAGVAMFVAPDPAIDGWPWKLTPLTDRVVGGVVALYGAVWLSVALDGRWAAARLILQAQMLGLVFLLVAVLRASDDFDLDRSLAWVYLAGVMGMLAASGLMHLWMDRRAHR